MHKNSGGIMSDTGKRDWKSIYECLLRKSGKMSTSSGVETVTHFRILFSGTTALTTVHLDKQLFRVPQEERTQGIKQICQVCLLLDQKPITMYKKN